MTYVPQVHENSKFIKQGEQEQVQSAGGYHLISNQENVERKMHRGIIPSWLKKRDLNGNMNANITEASLPSIENFTATSGINITTC